MSGFGGGGFGGGGGGGFGGNAGGGGFGGNGGGGGFGGNAGGGRNNDRGGRGRGRGRGRSNTRGGRTNGRGGGGGGRGNVSGVGAIDTILRCCSFYTTKGNCRNGNNCTYAHVAKLHAMIEATSVDAEAQQNNNNNYNNNYNKKAPMHPVNAVAIWETQGVVKIFTGSADGFWRLWNFTGQAFVKEFEHNMGGPVESLVVESNFLFCGFAGVSPSLPEVPVGMIHAWNLNNPADPPLEFQMQPPLIPYAHAQAVTQLLVVDGQKVVSGSRDGSIKLWAFDQAKGGFSLSQSIDGHAREITGLAVADSVLWSSSTDGSIRIWDMAKNGICQYAISSGTINPAQPPQGHANAVSSLCSFKSGTGTFILSASLDGDVKAWNGTTGQCVASESHGEGVVSMSMCADPSGKPFLLVGLESGSLMIRGLEPTPKIQQAFAPIMTFISDSSPASVGHDGAVKTVSKGPSGTFYSGGMDGKVLVFQITGDLGL